MDDLGEIKRKAYAKVDREYLPEQLEIAVGQIKYWQERQQEHWKAKDPRKAAICGQIITLYQTEARQVNARMKSWL